MEFDELIFQKASLANICRTCLHGITTVDYRFICFHRDSQEGGYDEVGTANSCSNWELSPEIYSEEIYSEE